MGAKYEGENEDDLKDQMDFMKQTEAFPELGKIHVILGILVSMHIWQMCIHW